MVKAKAIINKKKVLCLGPIAFMYTTYIRLPCIYEISSSVVHMSSVILNVCRTDSQRYWDMHNRSPSADVACGKSRPENDAIVSD
jgi:hypothetical protein